LYVSFDDGENWRSLQNNLPHAPVYWIAVQEHFNDLVLATYGRGFWILDDITPLQQMTSSAMDAEAYLFKPRPAYRFRSAAVPVSVTDDPTAGQNPPYGASIAYYFKTAPKGDVKVRIEDAKGQIVRTINGTKNAGLNRLYWDLRGEQTKEIRLRTSPAYAPEVRVGPEGWRPAPDGARISSLMPPGTYTVKLSGGGQELSQPLIVKKDPNSGGSEADIQAQTEMLLDLRKDIESAADMVNQIEVVRGQLDSVRALLSGGADSAQLKSSADDLDKKLLDIEDGLIQRKFTGQGQDTTRYPNKLISKLNYLGGGLASGDFGPTNQQREVHALFKEQLSALRKRLDEVMSKDVRAFNDMLRERGKGSIITKAQ
jgi:hypothetical protein